MSRGPGAVQTAVLARLDAAPSDTSVSQVCWEMAEEAREVIRYGKKVGPFDSGQITPSFYGSFRRALRTHEGIRSRLRSRRFTDLDGLCAAYPYRSLNLHVRQLRERVLPLVREYLDENRATQFTPAATELYVLETRVSEETATRAGEGWDRLRPAMFTALQDLQGDAQQALFELMVKGDELFRKATVHHGKSLRWVLKKASDAVAPTEKSATKLLGDIEALYESTIPKRVLRHAALKSRLCAIVDFGQDRSRAAFKPEFKTWLHQRDPGLVVSLPGHKSYGSRAPGGFYPIGPDLLTKFSPFLDQAIGRDALRKHEFVVAARA